jgi:hypothetical protein
MLSFDLLLAVIRTVAFVAPASGAVPPSQAQQPVA